MNETLLELATLIATFTGLTGVALVLYRLVGLREGGWAWDATRVASAVLAAVCGLSAFEAGLPWPIGAALLILAAVCAPARLSAHKLDTVLGWPWATEAALLLAGTLVAAWCLARMTPAPAPALWGEPYTGRSGLTETDALHATTDAGRHLPLYDVEGAGQSGRSLDDDDTLRERLGRVIRTGPPDLVYNCHGWLFADGRHWVKDSDVPTILEDNGYHVADAPRAGDLIIYHDDDNRLMHSGVVRAVQPDLILVESKWGKMGRYVHAVEDQPYAPLFLYFRSRRSGHTLAGVPPALPNPQATSERRTPRTASSWRF